MFMASIVLHDCVFSGWTPLGYDPTWCCLVNPGAAPAWDEGGGQRCVVDHALSPCLKHFLPEETHLVSQEMSFKCDDLDSVHTSLPPKFSYQVCKNLKVQLSEKVGGLVPLIPPLGSATESQNRISVITIL